MKRRALLIAGAVLASTGGAALAQRMKRVLYLVDRSLGQGVDAPKTVEFVTRQLAAAGFAAAGDVELETLALLGGSDDVAGQLATAVKRRPDVILSMGTFLTRAAQSATREIPIVFCQVADPLRTGIVTELAHPGANTTGVTQFFIQLAHKRLELIREILPSARRVAIVWDRRHEYWPGFHDEFIAAARTFHLDVAEGDMARGDRNWGDCYRQAMAGGRPDALMPIGPWPSQRALMDESMQQFQERTRIPVFYGGVISRADPLLVQLGADVFDHMGRGVAIVARILRGARPGDISIDQATRVLLKINLRSAASLGITIPKSVLLRADEVIQ